MMEAHHTMKQSMFPTLVLGLVAAFGGAFAWGVVLQDVVPKRACGGCSQFALEMYQSLHQDEWREGASNATIVRQEDGLTLWVGNGASYLEPAYTSWSSGRTPRAWNAGPGFASGEQRYVWTAYRDWRGY